MRTWKNYKQTFTEPSIFDFARSGDLAGLADLLHNDPHFELNQKNHKGYSALMLAIYNGQDVFAEALLRGGADPNSKDLVGNTILMGASFKGNIKLIELLISYGADINLENDAGMTAYDWAKTFGRKEVMEFLRARSESDLNETSQVKNYFNFIKLCLKLVLKKKGR